MEELLEVYSRPFDPLCPLVTMDEASKQLISETRLSIPMMPGRVERVDAEYRRNGTASVFMINAPLEGRRWVDVRPRRTAEDFAEIIRILCDVIYPDVEKIVLVMDNLNTHTTGSLYKKFPPEEARRLARKLEIHYTPKHGSWLNMAEIELSVLSRQCMNTYFKTIEELAVAVGEWERSRNETQTGIDWQFTVDKARTKLKRLYPTLLKQ
jgi:transposase